MRVSPEMDKVKACLCSLCRSFAILEHSASTTKHLDRFLFFTRSQPTARSQFSRSLHELQGEFSGGIPNSFAPGGEMTSAMATDEESLPAGVYRRKMTGKLYFEMRFPGGRFYSTKIATVEEGGLCSDIARRYVERHCCEVATRVGTPGGERGKRKAPLELNYPEYSAMLVLEDLPLDFDIQGNKEGAMKVILKQARAAARGLPKQAQAAAKLRAKVQKHLAPDVGSQRIDNRSSPHQNAHGSPLRGAKNHQDLAGVYRNNDVRKFFKDICEHSNQCHTAYVSKVSEREALERTVNGIKEDMGIIRLPKCGLDNFHQHMARLKNLISRDGQFSWSLQASQAYKSEESKCWKLRKIIEDHNLKSIPESLISDGNTMTGRRRANETERLPSVLEICPTDDQINFSMPIEISACCDPPASPLVLDVKPSGEKSIAMPSVVEMDTAQPVASYELIIGDEFTNEEIQSLLDTSTLYCDHWTRDWTDALFATNEADFQT